jgi:hypothetical protein
MLVREELDWDYLFTVASRHSMLPLLYWHLDALCSEAVPKARMAQLRSTFHATALYNRYCTGELLTLLQLFEGDGLPALPYKGPTLASAVYGDLALRRFSDLDLLVHQRDFSHATHLLLAQGFRYQRVFDWESSCVHDKRRVTVDLHRGLTPQRFHFPLDFERLWMHQQSICLAGTTVPTLAPEDLLLVLCAQAAKDAWQDLYQSSEWERGHGRLLQICDIAELLQSQPGMDWGRVLRDTRHLGGQRMLFFGLRVASELLDTVLPQDMRHQVQAHPTLGVLAAHIRAQWFHEADERCAKALTPVRFHFIIRERWRDRVFPYLYTGVVLFMPSDKDRAFVPLPGRLACLYYGIRPLRVLREYGLRGVVQRLKHWLSGSQ